MHQVIGITLLVSHALSDLVLSISCLTVVSDTLGDVVSLISCLTVVSVTLGNVVSSISCLAVNSDTVMSCHRYHVLLLFFTLSVISFC